jgi:hypothetical protein
MHFFESHLKKSSVFVSQQYRIYTNKFMINFLMKQTTQLFLVTSFSKTLLQFGHSKFTNQSFKIYHSIALQDHESLSQFTAEAMLSKAQQ